MDCNHNQQKKEQFKLHNQIHDLNGISYSLAWSNNSPWKTYYRRFTLKRLKKYIIGQYLQNLFFDEIIDLNFPCRIMIYGVQKDIDFSVIKTGFKNNDYSFIVFSEIFEIKKENIRFELQNLKKIPIRLTNNNHHLQLQLYKKDNNIGITLPMIQILKN